MKPTKTELTFECTLKESPWRSALDFFIEAKLETLKVCENVPGLVRFNVVGMTYDIGREARIDLHNELTDDLEGIDLVNTRDKYSVIVDDYLLLDAMYLCRINPKLEGVLNLIFLDDFKKPGGSDA